MDLDTLIERHRMLVRDGGSDKALAEVEAQVFTAAPHSVPRTGNHMLQWVGQVLKQSQNAVARRREIWLCGDAGEPLWARIAAGMPLGRSQRVLMAARARAPRRNPVAFRSAVEEELAKIDTPREGLTEEPLPMPEPQLPVRDFWQRLRAVVAEYIRPRLEAMPEHERDRLLNDFDRDVQAVFAHHSAKWQKESRSFQEQKRVSRQRFVSALRVLHMDPPRRNEPLAPIVAQANKQKRTLARLYHPDTHGGSEHTRPQYQAVLDAFLIVEQYVSENAKPVTPTLRVVNGGK